MRGDLRKRFRKRWLNLLNDESGQSMVEYLLLVTLIALAALVSIKSIGATLAPLFNWMGTEAVHYLNGLP